jgi:hypothetical protein
LRQHCAPHSAFAAQAPSNTAELSEKAHALVLLLVVFFRIPEFCGARSIVCRRHSGSAWPAKEF